MFSRVTTLKVIFLQTIWFFLFKYFVPSAIERSEIAPDDQPF